MSVYGLSEARGIHAEKYCPESTGLLVIDLDLWPCFLSMHTWCSNKLRKYLKYNR